MSIFSFWPAPPARPPGAPVENGVGDSVLAGTSNLWGAVEAVALRRASESALQKIIRLIKEAQQQKAPAQRFTDQFSRLYTYLVLVLSFAMFFVWWLGFGLSPFETVGTDKSAFYRTMTLLVVASPCALVLSIPSAVLAAVACGPGHGVLFRGGAAGGKTGGMEPGRRRKAPHPPPAPVRLQLAA